MAEGRARLGGALRDLGGLALIRAVELTRRGDPLGALAALDTVEHQIGIEARLLPYLAMGRAEALCALGRSDEARACVAGSGTPEVPLLAMAVGELQGRCLLTEGRAEEAVGVFAEVEAIAARAGYGEPCIVPWASGAIEAFLALSGRAALSAAAGEPEQAEVLYRAALENGRPPGPRTGRTFTSPEAGR